MIGNVVESPLLPGRRLPDGRDALVRSDGRDPRARFLYIRRAGTQELV
jgi:hypothetical protein